MFLDLIRKTRSCRRFDNSQKISREKFLELINYARLSGSSGNLQPLRFAVCTSQNSVRKISRSMIWGFFYDDTSAPADEFLPAGFIVIAGDKRVRKDFGIDAGIALQSIMLGAAFQNLAGCAFASWDDKTVRKYVKLSDDHEIVLLVAIGKPSQEILLEELAPGNENPTQQTTKYFLDESEKHHVPKLALADILLEETPE